MGCALAQLFVLEFSPKSILDGKMWVHSGRGDRTYESDPAYSESETSLLTRAVFRRAIDDRRTSSCEDREFSQPQAVA